MSVTSKAVYSPSSTSLIESVTYGLFELPSKTQEDRQCIYKTDNIFSFGVFDGHGGNYAAQACSASLHEDIIYKHNVLMSGGFFTGLSETLFCEVARDCTESIDELVKQESTAGTTMASLFFWSNLDGSIRVICPWIGDSRCVRYQRDKNGIIEIFPMTEDHKPSLKREEERINNCLKAPWVGEPIEAIDSPTRNRSMSFSEQLSIKSEQLDVQDNTSVLIRKLSMASMISMTGTPRKLSNFSDTSLVNILDRSSHALSDISSEGMEAITTGNLPKTLNNLSIDKLSPTHARTGLGFPSKLSNNSLVDKLPFDGGNYRKLSHVSETSIAEEEKGDLNTRVGLTKVMNSPNRINRFSLNCDTNTSICSFSPNSPQRTSNELSNYSPSIFDIERKFSNISEVVDNFSNRIEYIEDPNRPPKVNERSFIAHRTKITKSGNKIIGPLAVCSRYDVSITMTRSIGDRYGPRSCIAQPDISSVTIQKNEHARFVLASDGLWDVYSDEELRTFVMSDRDPNIVAKKLAQMAYQRRLQSHIKIDDITVFVIDVNASLMVTDKKLSFPMVVKSSCGCLVS